MKISELPPEIRELALLRQKECTNKASIKDTKYLSQAFEWGKTKEGYQFWYNFHNNKGNITQDQNVNEVIESFKQRSEIGFNKYGTNTERKDIDLLGWLNHLQEELMDATIYIQRLKKEL
jgi:hypothetical protein